MEEQPKGSYPRWRKPSREIAMTRMDEAIFSLALGEEFPGITFEDIEPSVRAAPILRDSIADCNSPVVRGEVPAPPRSPTGWFQINRSSWRWVFGRTVGDNARFAFDPPTLTGGWIATGWDLNDPAHRAMPAFQRKVWRIVERLTTNRLKTGTPRSNTLEWGSDIVTMAEAKRQNLLLVWAGHHALEWCAAGGARRMLVGAFRPCDDWAPPQDPWYLRLRRRVEERYGTDFGLPSAPEG
jgi:hypothetical protein